MAALPLCSPTFSRFIIFNQLSSRFSAFLSLVPNSSLVNFYQMKIVIPSLVLTRLFFAMAAHPQITTAPYPVVRQAGNDICGYYPLDDTSTSFNVHYDISTLLTDTSPAHTLTCALGCAVAATTIPAVKYCLGTGVWSDTPVTTQFDYGYWPIDGCEAGQGCW